MASGEREFVRVEERERNDSRRGPFTVYDVFVGTFRVQWFETRFTADEVAHRLRAEVQRAVAEERARAEKAEALVAAKDAAFGAYLDAIERAQRMYHNCEEWTEEERGPIQAALNAYYADEVAAAVIRARTEKGGGDPFGAGEVGS